MINKRPLLDTNIIIRFLTNDPPNQAEKIEKLFSQASSSSLEIPDVVIFEIVYVLLSFYQLSKEEVIEKIYSLINFEKIKTNKKLIKKTLEIFKNYPISFIDAYLCALIFLKKHPFIYSFDKKLKKIKGIKIKEP